MEVITGPGSAESVAPTRNQLQTGTYTVEDAIEHCGVGRFQVQLFILCGLFTITDAIEMMMVAVLAPELRCEWWLDDWQVALITALIFITMFIGSTISGTLSDIYGRRPILVLSSCWIAYFGILTSQSPNYPWFVILRCLVAFGFGGTTQAFTLLTEYLPSKYRAKILTMCSGMWALGVTVEILMAYVIIPRAGWRVLVLASALPMIITVLCSYAIPESARYLVAADEKEKALKVLKHIALLNKTSLPPGELTNSDLEPQGRFTDLFSPGYKSLVLINWLLWFGAASVYYGAILAQSQILEMGGVCKNERTVRIASRCHCNPLSADDYVSMIVSTFGEFLALPLNLLTIDVWGRKWNLTVNFFGSGVFCLLCMICSSQNNLLTVFMFGVRSFIQGVFNVIFIYTAEVFPTTVRALGLGTSNAASRVGGLVTPFVAQVLMSYSIRLSLGTYGFLAFICAVGAMFLPIETLGRPLLQSHSSLQ